MPAPCELDRDVWTCILVRENGYQAIALWRSAKSFCARYPHLGTS
jgi:hypothetical protein